MAEQKNHPSLPANYVTIAQLKERWLKQKNQTNQHQPQPEQPPLQKPQAQAPSIVGTASRSHPSKQYRVKDRNESLTNRRVIDSTTVDHRESEFAADRDSRVRNSKKMKKMYFKPIPKKEGKSRGGVAAQGNEEEGERTEIGSELKEKMAIGSEVKEEKSGNLVKVEEIEEKFRVLATKGDQNGRRFRNGFGQSEPERNCYGGRGHGREQRFQVRVERSGKMVWVRKDNGEIET